MSGGPSPSLFGRVTLVHSQHESLARLLGRLEEMAHRVLRGDLTGVRAGAGLPGLLSECRRQLLEHFSAEEGPAHFETIAADRPSLLPTIVDLRADHEAMRSALAHLEAVVSNGPPGEPLARGIAALVARFRSHERAEAEMVAEYLERNEPSS